jgi:hypothetical protein
MKKLYFAFGIALLGCGTDSSGGPELIPELEEELVPAPKNGVQIISPIFEPIMPTTDYEICTWTDFITTEVTDVKWTMGFQTEPPGHHVIVFYTLDKQPPGTQRVCNDTDMATFRFLAGNGGNKEKNEAPGDLVYRIPPGAQVVMNHHYLNASDEVLRGQSAVNIAFADPGNWIPSGNTAVVDVGLEVQPGITTQTMHCDIDRELKLWYFAPHMHRWGKSTTVDVTQAGEKHRIFDLPEWNEAWTFHPPEVRKDPKDPMILKPGDAIDVSCTWNNNEGRVLNFGFEMCVAFGQFVDDKNIGNIACNAGQWIPF